MPVGFESENWIPMGISGQFSAGQLLADTRSLCFTSESTDEGMEILGNPDINLVITSDNPEALFSVLLKIQIP